MKVFAWNWRRSWFESGSLQTITGPPTRDTLLNGIIIIIIVTNNYTVAAATVVLADEQQKRCRLVIWRQVRLQQLRQQCMACMQRSCGTILGPRRGIHWTEEDSSPSADNRSMHNTLGDKRNPSAHLLCVHWSVYYTSIVALNALTKQAEWQTTNQTLTQTDTHARAHTHAHAHAHTYGNPCTFIIIILKYSCFLVL